MSKQTVRCPLDVADLDDHLGPHPMNAAKHQRRSEPAASWWRYRKRHLVDRQRLEALPQALQFGTGQTCPGSACIDEPAVWCVIAEQQRPDPMAAALRITPSDDDKFLSVEALDLEPRTPVGLVPAIDALRDDALDAIFAREPMKGRAMTDLVIIVPKAIRRIF